MDELRCDCGSRYFYELSVNRFNKISAGPHTGYQAKTMDAWKVYQCLNSKCEKVIIPELSSFAVPKNDLRVVEELLRTVSGDPKDAVEAPERPLMPGIMSRRQ